MKEAPVGRRRLLSLTAGTFAAAAVGRGQAFSADADTIRFGLTPVLLTSDLNLLELLRSYLEKATGRPVELVTRRTYQEITALLISGRLNGAWICSPPFITYTAELELLAVPVWNGRPLYRSYVIADARREATSLEDLEGDVHAFSDPDSNSGYVATAAELAARAIKPEQFFRRTFFTYGHRNVVRAVASGLAQSGSVDGYVYEVLKEVEPGLTDATRVVRASPWFGFPPIAGPRAAAGSESRDRLRHALLRRTRTSGPRAAAVAQARCLRRRAAVALRRGGGQHGADPEARVRRLGRLAARMPITVKAPIVVVLLMLAIGVVMSERVLSRLVDSQERQLGDLANAYLDGLASPLIEPILRGDPWEVFDILDRAKRSVLRRPAGRDHRDRRADRPRQLGPAARGASARPAVRLPRRPGHTSTRS